MVSQSTRDLCTPVDAPLLFGLSQRWRYTASSQGMRDERTMRVVSGYPWLVAAWGSASSGAMLGIPYGMYIRFVECCETVWTAKTMKQVA
eukprot:6491407-Amphidinium_carterae.1